MFTPDQKCVGRASLEKIKIRLDLTQISCVYRASPKLGEVAYSAVFAEYDGGVCLQNKSSLHFGGCFFTALNFQYLYVILYLLLLPNLAAGGGIAMSIIISLVVSIVASIISFYICKWLDRN